MAKPRIFVSSTFYDLKYIRADLERFIRGMGYEPVLNERGHVPYESQKSLDEYCYEEVERCDILIGIIGGRHGTLASSNEQSITHTEIDTALDAGKQVYIFIEKNVDSQFYTYLENKTNIDIDSSKIKYSGIEDIKIFEYIDNLRKRSRNNTIHIFEKVEDICDFLQEQWAGLFKKFLQQQAKYKYSEALEEIKNTSQTLKTLVDYLSAQNNESRDAIKDILLSTHPAIERVKEILSINARIYFSSKRELFEWLEYFDFSSTMIDSKALFHLVAVRLEIENFKEANYLHSAKLENGIIKLIFISSKIFDNNGSLLPSTKEGWSKENIIYKEIYSKDYPTNNEGVILRRRRSKDTYNTEDFEDI